MLGRTLRIAGIFHLFANHGHDEVLQDDLERALGLQEYFIAHAKAAHGIIEQGHVSDSERVLEWMRKHQPVTVTMRELRKGLRWQDGDQAWAAMSRLIDLGYLKRVEVSSTGKGGRPTTLYVPHPMLSLH
jgi:hypothetical protein